MMYILIEKNISYWFFTSLHGISQPGTLNSRPSFHVFFFFLRRFNFCRMSTDSSNNSDTSGDKVPDKSLGTLASLSGRDFSSLQITTHKLNGRNYIQWTQSIKIVICGHGKLGYLTTELQAPNISDPSYKVWVAENSVFLVWPFNSMEPCISRCCLWFQTAKEVWDAARNMYSDLGNSSQIFELRSNWSLSLRERSRSLTTSPTFKTPGKNWFYSLKIRRHVQPAVSNSGSPWRKRGYSVFWLA